MPAVQTLLIALARIAGLALNGGATYSSWMTAVEIIEEIKRLPRAEQNQVMDFVRKAESRRLTPDELGELAKQMTETKDPAEADRLQEEIVRGFYGRPADA
ncbi:MAG TPA: hypothetical protein VGN61_15150 [Verrucomicrobiae bacterium]|jgi:hypothetical protein